ncbi:MAG: SurA N-terminal domain-containing protein [Bacteroidota bacterium]
MGVMERLRNSTAIILWILIGSFGIIWVLADVNFFDAVNQGPSALGSVNGEAITYQEYSSRLEYYSSAYTQQTGAAFTDEIRAVYEGQVWDELVNSKLLNQKMDELGITVTDEELLNMVYGDNPDPLIRQFFQREDGTVDRVAVQQVLTNEQYSQEAQAIEVQLRQKRRQEKLTEFVTAGLQVSSIEVEEAYVRENSFAEISFIRFPYNEVKDEEIVVSDADLEAYYEQNKDRYKQEESYRMNYVTFSKLPTATDTVEILKEVGELRDSFAESDNDSLFLVRRGSIIPYNGSFVAEGDLKEEYKQVLDLNEGEVSEPFLDSGRASIIKLIEKSGNEVRFAVMSYMIEALPVTIDAAAEDAEDFQYFATEERSFEEEANQRSLNLKSGFATKGNAFISGMGSSQQVLNFLENGSEGDVSDVIELGTDFVVLEITEVQNEGYRPFSEVQSQIENSVKQQKRQDAMLAKVEGLYTGGTSLEDLGTATEKEVIVADNVRLNAMVISGAGREPEMVGAIFAMETGQVSAPFKGATGVYVFRVDNKTQADVATLDQITRDRTTQQLEQQKSQRFLTVWLERLKEDADIEDNRDRLLVGG